MPSIACYGFGMRHVVALIVLLGAGCGGSHSSSSYLLYLDDAEIVGAAAGRKPWCAGGGKPDVFATVEAGGGSATSSTAPATFHPVWDEPLLDADEASFVSGMKVEVRGQCDQHEFSLGTIVPQLDPSSVEGGGIMLSRFSGVYQIRMHFVGDGGVVAVDPGYYDPGYYDNYDYGFTYSDPGYDDTGDF